MFATLSLSQMAGQMAGAAGQVTAWLLTYALHSTLFLGLAWLASRRLSRWARLEEAVWRFALLAGLATASLQLAAGWEPLAGRWTLEAPARSVALAPAATDISPAARELGSAASRTEALPVVRRAPLAPASSEIAPAWRVDLRTAVLAVWAFGALLLAARWGWSYARLSHRLRARPEVVGGGIFTLLGKLSGELGFAPLVRLTCSSKVSVPVALGVLRPEICVPPRALSHLEPEQQEGMLAHELAHLVRRDPFWLAFTRLLNGVLFFQPLNRVAARRLRELSEQLCDAWAVERTGRPLSLARCLAEVAGWSVTPLRQLPVPSMADRPSSLARRIRHLLDDARSPERRVRPLWLAIPMLIVLVGVAAVAPGVYAGSTGGTAGGTAAAKDRPAAGEPAELTGSTGPSLPGEPAADDLTDLDAALDNDLDPLYDRLDDLAELQELGELDGLAELAQLGDMGDLTAMAPLLAQIGELSWDGGKPMSEADQKRLEEMAERLAADAGRMSEQYADEYAALAEKMAKEMEPEIERIAERVSRDMAPEIERISEEVNRNRSPEIERISQEVAERMSRLEPEMERLHMETERLRREGALTDAERDRIRQQAHELARRARPSAEELKAFQEAQRKYREDVSKLMAEHREEIEAARENMRMQADDLRRQLDADPKLRELRERHRRDAEQLRGRRDEIQKERQRMRIDRERAREREEGQEKPPAPPARIPAAA